MGRKFTAKKSKLANKNVKRWSTHINCGEKMPVNKMTKYFTPITLKNLNQTLSSLSKEARNPRCTSWHGNWQRLPRTISLKSSMCNDFIITIRSRTLKKLSHEWMRRFATAFLVAARNCRRPRCSPWGPGGSRVGA